ncbi:hypothetical protein MPTK1_4g03750 [Marchantia polymorpha subsp. ruderalis]|uniref:Uncharacterized protein n=2 Tax=Marchantia polymorpha TaxID=3197 RepID=A0AAF6B5Z1_MARPO|nr:hypothetical protein MARPO_0044s0099 [Marchantia polymorpha]BBN07425.1 hypothetical protein Mp_4g03750 [Marchantia polymorpha subsp. ruderalis]|eukprot:PTQ39676.1 hypothetical protein MARPO_0044s0099 [Marchantia polymorpha]
MKVALQTNRGTSNFRAYITDCPPRAHRHMSIPRPLSDIEPHHIYHHWRLSEEWSEVRALTFLLRVRTRYHQTMDYWHLAQISGEKSTNIRPTLGIFISFPTDVG